MKICLFCKQEKSDEHFHKSQLLRKISKCIECVKKYDNNPKAKARRRKHRNLSRKEWEIALQQRFGTPHCQICGRQLRWFGNGKTESVHWDHRNGYDSTRHPSDILRCRYSEERFNEFIARNYGILCNSCNRGLPTDLRLRKGVQSYLGSKIGYNIKSRHLKTFFEDIQTALAKAEFSKNPNDMVVELLKSKKIVAIGNGGSNAIAHHLVIDLTNMGIPATTLDVTTMTALANDNSWDTVYQHWLPGVVGDDDGVVIISSSGMSPNMVLAAEAVNRYARYVLTLSGFDPNNLLRTCGHDNIYVPSSNYGIVECSHQIILHGMTNYLGKL